MRGAAALICARPPARPSAAVTPSSSRVRSAAIELSCVALRCVEFDTRNRQVRLATQAATVKTKPPPRHMTHKHSRHRRDCALAALLAATALAASSVHWPRVAGKFARRLFASAIVCLFVCLLVCVFVSACVCVCPSVCLLARLPPQPPPPPNDALFAFEAS